MERSLAKYFEDPSQRLASLIDRPETVVDEADSTGRISKNAVQELRLVLSMLSETDAYRLAASARALNAAADTYASLHLKAAASELSDAAAARRALKLNCAPLPTTSVAAPAGSPTDDMVALRWACRGARGRDQVGCHHRMMADRTNMVQLHEVVSNVLHDICQNVSHPRLDGELIRFGLPASSAGESKAERAESSIATITVDQLPAIAQRLLDGYEFLGSPTRNRIQDLLWAGTGYSVPKRIRRDVARRLPLAHLVDQSARFRALLGNLFVLDDTPLAALVGRDRSLGGRIDQHVFNNDDWTAERLFEELGAIDASDRRFALLLEGMVSSETIPDEQAQRDLVAAINPPLADAGLALRETGTSEGYPVFTLLKARSRTGRPKNLIFASPVKPDLRLSDAIDNDIEIVSNADAVLVYDRPIGADGVRWRDLQAWWRDTRATDSDEQAKTDLYRRLRQSLPSSSPPQRLLFDLYHDIHRDRANDLPALLPEVWLHWDPQTVKQRGAAALLHLRMDFLLLVPGSGRIVLEVDGQTHYAIDGRADPATYARTMTGSRTLTLAGYEVHRFGAHDLRDHDRAHGLLTQFFADLFRRHQVTTD